MIGKQLPDDCHSEGKPRVSQRPELSSSGKPICQWEFSLRANGGSLPFGALLGENGTRDTLAGRLGSIFLPGLGFDLGEIFPALADIFALACRFS